MRIIIQKFGGSSLANTENRQKAISKIMKKYKKGYKIVVVVSAIGRKGDPYATDTLLSLVNSDCIDNRDLDLLLSCGEIISATILANLLRQKNIPVHVLTGHQAGIETDNRFGGARVLSVHPSNIMNRLNDNNIVIVTGFQGATLDGEITTLGRGGSDTTAIILGEALNCEFVEIYTDVDGVMTADPRIVPDAKVINSICYSELYQLAEDGAKVIHPRAVEIAERGNIIVKIRNTLNDCEGTIVALNEESVKRVKNINKKKQNVINAITYKKNRVQVSIDVTEEEVDIEGLMKRITEKNISIDLINFLTDRIIFTIDYKRIEALEKILKTGNYPYKFKKSCCKLSLIGYKMRGKPGVMSKIISALYKEKIDILQTSDSHTTIWCLIYEEDAVKAIRALHKELI